MAEKKIYKANRSGEGLFYPHKDIVFSQANGAELKMWLYLPADKREKTPLFVFIQGSGWTAPNIHAKNYLFALLASNGIAVATVTHRDRRLGHPLPAALCDVKTAIRYLRKNAERFNIDTENIFVGGSSSGGHLALMCGYTADNAEYKLSYEYSEFSDKVNGIVAACAPTEMLSFAQYVDKTDEWGVLTPGLGAFSDSFCGVSNYARKKLLYDMSPIYAYENADESKKAIPVLLMHGTEDAAVEISYSDRMYEILERDGRDVGYIVIDGADHDKNMWSVDTYREILSFIKAHIRR